MLEKIPLTTEENRSIFIKKSNLEAIKFELESFCNETKFANNESFPKEILFTHELKNNNAIEGYYEDLASIINIVNNPYLHQKNLDKEYQRILNLYKGYEYILTHDQINEKTLNELYKILSCNLLSPSEQLLPDLLYRHDDVFIHFSNNLALEPDKGFDAENIQKHMNELFDYINNNDATSSVELFFKSQIIHFYMVYIHPYFDINGRTSRTTSLWFLNQYRAYPYTIFNRAIQYNKSDYYRIIRDVKKFKDLTSFINFVAIGTKIELEKEYVIRSITEAISHNLTPINKQILQYILSNKSQNTLIDIQNFYNRFNPRRNIRYINEELLEPLLEYGIILKTSNTNKHIYSNKFNYRFILNEQKLDFDKSKIKRLNMDKLYR